MGPGTNASNRDTDGDGVGDGREVDLGADPTFYDYRPPQLTIQDTNYYVPQLSLDTFYSLRFQVEDRIGIERVEVRKNGVRFEDTPNGSLTETTYNVDFTTGPLETTGDSLLGDSVDVYVEDSAGNNKTTPALKRSGFYGELASKLGSETIFATEIAGGLGALSGFSSGAGEAGVGIASLITNPLGVLDSLSTVTAILEDPSLLGDIIAALPEQIEQRQQLANPYDESAKPELYNAYRDSWYAGYGSFTVVTFLVSGEKVAKYLKDSSKLRKLIERSDRNGRLDDAIAAYKQAIRDRDGNGEVEYDLARTFSDGGCPAGSPSSLHPFGAVGPQVQATCPDVDVYLDVFDGGADTATGRHSIAIGLEKFDNSKLANLDPPQRRTLGRYLQVTGQQGGELFGDLSSDEVDILLKIVGREALNTENVKKFSDALGEADDVAVGPGQSRDNVLTTLETIADQEVAGFDDLVGKYFGQPSEGYRQIAGESDVALNVVVNSAGIDFDDVEIGQSVTDVAGWTRKKSSEIDVEVTGDASVTTIDPADGSTATTTLNSPAIESKHWNPNSRSQLIVNRETDALTSKLTAQASAGNKEFLVVVTKEYLNDYGGELSSIPSDVKQRISANSDIDPDEIRIEFTTYEKLGGTS